MHSDAPLDRMIKGNKQVCHRKTQPDSVFARSFVRSFHSDDVGRAAADSFRLQVRAPCGGESQAHRIYASVAHPMTHVRTQAPLPVLLLVYITHRRFIHRWLAGHCRQGDGNRSPHQEDRELQLPVHAVREHVLRRPHPVQRQPRPRLRVHLPAHQDPQGLPWRRLRRERHAQQHDPHLRAHGRDDGLWVPPGMWCPCGLLCAALLF